MADLISMLAAAAGASGAEPVPYQISRSLRFNSADSAYLSRTPASAGNRKTWTWSGWVKRSELTGVQQLLFGSGADDANKTNIRFDTDNSLRFVTFDAGSATDDIRTSAIYRDVSAWMHIVVASDTTQATDSDRAKIYINGVQVTALQTSNYPTLNFDTDINTTEIHSIGRNNPGANQYYGGYLTQVHFVDGQALTPSDFGETDATTGVWKPKAYAGTYGTNGFYLNFSDNSGVTAATLGADSSGNGNNWTPNNFSVTAGAGNDSLVDTPTPYGTDTGVGGEVRGNYATFNALDKSTAATTSNGNLNVVFTGAGNGSVRSTIGVSSGKWYWEVTPTTVGNGVGIGVLGPTANINTWPSIVSGVLYVSTAKKNINGTETSFGATYTDNDIIGVALDVDSGTITFYKNNVSQGTISGSLPDVCFPSFSDGSGVTAGAGYINFGQRPFAYTAPSGFKALCTQNLPTPTVVQGDDYFNTVLYTGNGSTQSITGVGFQPDFVWLKERSSTSGHRLNDAVRGAGYALISDSDASDSTAADRLTSFDSDGFSVGNASAFNENAVTYVAWNWNAGGSNATNTDGTITSTVRANTTAGFSIVLYTGTGSAATIGHGLGATPAMIIVKNRDAADPWQVYHQANTAAPETDYLVLSSTAATVDSNTRWNDTAPTSSVFSVGTSANTNTNTEEYIAYVFAEIEGFSKFGSYVGNGSADGPFVYCGFRPAFVLIKGTTYASNWNLLDDKRDSENPADLLLRPNLADAEFSSLGAGSGFVADFVSNGFKLRQSYADSNSNNNTLIFMAFAENPFKYSLAR